MLFEQKVAFNAEWVRSQTFEQFAAHEAHHGLSEEKLREAYGLYVKEPVATGSAAKAVKQLKEKPPTPAI
jgi:hypothetical protein